MLQKLLSQAWVQKLLTHPLLSKLLNYEFISYLICGILTTFINWASYYFLDLQGLPTAGSTAIAWFLSVVFAFFVNKIFVFLSKSWTFSVVWSEFLPFIACRILSGIFDVIFMVITVDCLHFNHMLAKILSNIVVMLANYFASKFLIFKK